jgi:hypothetical protein
VRVDYCEGLARVEGQKPGPRCQASNVRNSVTKQS